MMSHNPLNTVLEANKFDGTNYSNWLRNLRIVLDFENQTYVLDKSLPQTLPEGFLPGERLTFQKFTQWHEDNRKVRSIVLSSMTNEIQKQYERYEDVWSIMHRMKKKRRTEEPPKTKDPNKLGKDPIPSSEPGKETSATVQPVEELLTIELTPGPGGDRPGAHHLNLDPSVKPVKQKKRHFGYEKDKII
ncbi:UNVERIFIED_CONTAM: hypothetical protein Scaly_2742200 [Sesamum calycinum]|uniref:Retrotransposon Copia-like N-terminal domain-containing protein n=1 Tax=Sesamum calycinum TaxID=2727403 RepID=A0AAW2J1U5_9LAMI